MKKKLFLLIFVFVITFCTGKATDNTSYKYGYLYEYLPFKMPYVHPPTFPCNQVNVADFDGVADGITLNSEAFEKAFAALAEKGGGTLIVPAGIWFTGPIVFRSNINLHLEKGALILFSPDFDLYPLVNAIYEGSTTKRCRSPISGSHLENIAITGEGVINGSGEAWRPVKKAKISATQWKQITASGGVLKNPDYWFPSEKSLLGETMNANTQGKNFTDADWLSFKDYLRPVMVSFIECKNVWLEGVTFENSPSWNIHPLMCENLIIDRITVRNPPYAQNGDGLDLESCVNAIIVNSSFDVGDDGICIKSGKNEEGRKRGRPTTNVIVDNCTVFQGHGGFVVGSEMSGGVRNISVSNCRFLGTDVGLRFKSGRGRGGVVEDIYINNIYMFNIATEPFLFDLYYGSQAGDSALTFPVDETTPVFRNIHVKNLTARKARRAMFFNGLPEMNISNISVEDVIISSTTGAEISESDGLFFKNIRIIPEKGPAFILNNVQNMTIDNPVYPDMPDDIVSISGSKSKNIRIPKRSAQTPAFPGAEGGGMYTTGGRGGVVYFVNTLEDTNTGNTATREGSLRWCLGQTETRTIVFKVSGTIFLRSALRIDRGNVTIAGQTAPGDGICLANYPVSVWGNNIIIRYLRFRMGEENGDDGADALGGRFFTNVIVDHCSASWSVDECVSFYNCNHFTLQWCLISESLRQSAHSKGSHGYGGIWGGTDATFHHNLMAHHDSRCPRFGPGVKIPPRTETVDFRNNVNYNHGNTYGGEAMNINLVNNYYKPGPGSATGTDRGRILSFDMEDNNESSIRYNVWGQLYVNGNVVDDGNNNTYCNNATNDNWQYGIYNQFHSGYGTVSAANKAAMKMDKPFGIYGLSNNQKVDSRVTTHAAKTAYEKVLDYVGASLSRDSYDARIINEVRTGTTTFKGASTTKPGIIDKVSDTKPANAGDDWLPWPALASGDVPAYTAAGVPEGWLESNYQGKQATDLNEEGYTYLEVYLNSLVANITDNQNATVNTEEIQNIFVLSHQKD
jgi:polygalacturonase